MKKISKLQIKSLCHIKQSHWCFMSREEDICLWIQSFFMMAYSCILLFCFQPFQVLFFCIWLILFPCSLLFLLNSQNFASHLLQCSGTFWLQEFFDGCLLLEKKKKNLKGFFSSIFSVCFGSRVHIAHLPTVSLNFHLIHHMQEIQGFPRSLDPSSLLHIMLLVCLDSCL